MRKARIKWLRERDIMMKMMNMYIIYSCKDHLKESKDGMGDGVRWLGGRWEITLYPLSIV